MPTKSETKEIDFQLIANLLAGRGEAKIRLENLKKFLSVHDLSFRSLEIISPTPISQIPNDGRIKIKKGVVCLGGDGTISESIGYLLNNGLDLPLALIPTGTANIIATTLNIQKNKDDFNFLLDNKTSSYDVGVAEYQNEKYYFLLGLGLGFEEKFLKLAKEKLKRKLGIFSYILAALAELLSLNKISLKIKTPTEETKTNVCLLNILNLHPVIMNFFPLFKDDKLKGNDKILNLYYVEYKNYFQALAGTLAYHFLGKRNLGLVKEILDKEFLLESSRLVETQIDGELRGNLPVKISLSPYAIDFLC